MVKSTANLEKYEGYQKHYIYTRVSTMISTYSHILIAILDIYTGLNLSVNCKTTTKSALLINT